MTAHILRYALLGFAVTLGSMAWSDTIYTFSGKDENVAFGGVRRGSVPEKFSGSVADNRGSPLSPMKSNSLIFANKSRYDLLVEKVARGYQIDSALLHAVISVESSYDPKAQSPAGALGLMQLMPATARRYGVSDALDPEQNIRGGARYLRDLLSMFGSDIRLALAAYHAGENAVVRHQNSIPPFQATIDFVSRVLELYHDYRGSRH